MAGLFVRGETAEVYHQRRLDVASNGGLRIIDEQTPAHYHHFITTPRAADEEETAAQFLGAAYHCAVLEPEVFADTYRIVPVDAPKDLRRFRDAKKPSNETLDAIAWWDMWEAENAGKILVSTAVRENMIAMATSQRRMVLDIGGIKIVLSELIDECDKEVSGYWVDPETGIRCKLRFDLMSEELNFGGDLKTAMDAGAEAFARTMAKHGYHRQEAHYCEGYREITGRPLSSFMFLPVEKAAPFLPSAWIMGPASHELGYNLTRRALGKLQACLKSDTWPGYPNTAKEIELPTWAHYQLEDPK